MQAEDNQHYEGDVLVVDDTVINVRILVNLLQQAGYKMRAATSGRAALALCEKRPPDMVLLDVMMPEMNGYEVCRQLQADEKTRGVPVIFISALSDAEDKVKALEAGGVDFINKPFDSSEVLARVKTHIRLHQLKRELLEKNRELEELAVRDPITGLHNRRSLMEYLAGCQRVSKRYATSCAMVMLDIDRFNEIGEQFGHDVGDQILRVLAERIRRLLRETDFIARWRGGAFMILLQFANEDGALKLAERLRESIAWDPVDPAGVITASFGVVYNQDSGSPEQMVDSVHKALQTAKQSGPGSIHVAADE